MAVDRTGLRVHRLVQRAAAVPLDARRGLEEGPLFLMREGEHLGARADEAVGAAELHLPQRLHARGEVPGGAHLPRPAELLRQGQEGERVLEELRLLEEELARLRGRQLGVVAHARLAEQPRLDPAAQRSARAPLHQLANRDLRRPPAASLAFALFETRKQLVERRQPPNQLEVQVVGLGALRASA